VKLTIDTKLLASALKRVLPATKGGHLPISSGVLIEAEEKIGVTLTATNLNLTITTDVACNVDEPGRVIVSGALFANAVTKGKTDSLVIAASDDGVEIVAGRSRTRLRQMSVEDFPSGIEYEETASIHLSPTHLHLIGKVFHAADPTNAKPTMQCLCFEGSKVTASDSYRAAMVELGIDVPRAVVNVSSLGEVLRAADSADGVLFEADDKRVRFSDDKTAWVIRQTEGDFPNLERLYPTKLPHKLSVGRVDLVEAIERTGVVAAEKIPIKLTLSADQVELTVHTPDVGDAEDSIDASYSGDAMTIGFEPRIISDAIAQCEADSVELALTDPHKPVRIDEGQLALLIMPRRLA
jgi:DNA polymerase-3 subunit beta